MKTLLVDGPNLCWRLIKVMPELTAKGQAVEAVYGMLRLVRVGIMQFTPDVVLVCWDQGRSAYRKKIYPDYKNNRDHDSTPEKEREYKSVNTQIEILKHLLEKLNVASVTFPAMEADDLIGIAAKSLAGEKVIITSDQDAMHLVDSDVSVWSPHRTILYTQENFRKMTGLSPQQFLEMRALTGDKSDNIQGVARGFGPVTATELLVKYESIEKLYSSSVAKKIEHLGNKQALLYSEGARERAYRNLLLMDLRICSSREGGTEIMKLIEEKMKARHRIDKLAVRKYFINSRFQTFLSEFSTWMKPFEDLDT